MGQPEVYDYLKENKDRWFTARDIKDETELSIGSISVALKRLRKSGLVDYQLIKTEGYKGAKRGTMAYRYKKDQQTVLFSYIPE